jgi:hypothetical protein
LLVQFQVKALRLVVKVVGSSQLTKPNGGFDLKSNISRRQEEVVGTSPEDDQQAQKMPPPDK